ncbi:hypothetical protein BDZ45DRAFT_199879 [Acephala macrosclerotiorum]|nr:hypothetical protein BDZ45DRAFT_199879 [Acephala macrosclerotiorum]
MSLSLYEEQVLSSTSSQQHRTSVSISFNPFELSIPFRSNPTYNMNLLAAAILFLHLVAAIPTPVTLPRSCTTITPTSLQALDNTWPDVPLSRTVFSGTSNLMITHDNINASNPTHTLQLVEFSVPPNSSPCQLQSPTPPAASPSLIAPTTLSPSLST